MSFIAILKKYLYCKIIHNQYLCYPEVWGRGLKGPWHCSKCEPCGAGLQNILRKFRSQEEGDSNK